METRIIPIFPLSVVLFPGMMLPLRIFEPRYRLMTQRLLEGDATFGIVLIQEGEEVGGPAKPYQVGTLAEITEAKRSPDGQYMLQTVGLRRFRILREIEGEPYAQAEIEILDEADLESEIDTALLERAKAGILEYVASLATLTRMRIDMPEQGLSAIDWSFLMAAALQISNEDKQAVLEIDDLEARLEKLVELIDAENEEVRAFLTRTRERGDIFVKGVRLSLN